MADPGNESSVVRDGNKRWVSLFLCCVTDLRTIQSMKCCSLAFPVGPAVHPGGFSEGRGCINTYFRVKDVHQTVQGKPKHMAVLYRSFKAIIFGGPLPPCPPNKRHSLI